jgi:hypothetical protein
VYSGKMFSTRLTVDRAEYRLWGYSLHVETWSCRSAASRSLFLVQEPRFSLKTSEIAREGFVLPGSIVVIFLDVERLVEDLEEYLRGSTDNLQKRIVAQHPEAWHTLHVNIGFNHSPEMAKAAIFTSQHRQTSN